MKLWSAETVSQVGTQVTMLALPLTAIGLLHASAFEVGLLTTMEFLPFLVVGLPAGVWVDRLRRRPILIAGDLARAAILGSIPLAYGLGVLHIVQLYLVAFLTGVCTVFFDVSYQSYLPSLVDREHLVDGNAKLEISRSGAQLAGPGIAGALIQLLKAPVAIVVDAVSYLGSAAFIFLIRRSEPAPHPHPDGEAPRMRTQIAEGIRYVVHDKYIGPISACTGISNLFSSMAFAMLILFARKKLELSPGDIGIIFALSNIGFLLGAFLARPVADRFKIGPTIIGSVAIGSMAAFLIPLATKSNAWVMLIAAMFVFGLGGVIYNINQVSLRQAITPDRMLGRMNASVRFIVWGTMPIGAFIGGILGNTIGLRPTLWISAIGGSFCFLPPLLSPVRHLKEIPDVDPNEVTAVLDDPLEPVSPL